MSVAALVWPVSLLSGGLTERLSIILFNSTNGSHAPYQPLGLTRLYFRAPTQ